MAGNGTSLRFEVTATGEPLTAEQLESLSRVFHAVEDMFELAEHLFPGQ